MYHKTKTFIALLIFLIPSIGFTGEGDPVDKKKLFKDVEKSLICQCATCTHVLNDCICAFSDQMRLDIDKMIAEGVTIKKDILDAHIEKYGEAVLGAPKKEGFNLTAYIMPFLAILIAGTLIVFTLIRWVKKGQSHQAEIKEPVHPEQRQKEKTYDSVYEERLAEELEDLM